jgi:acetyl esterase/lipase
MSISLRARFWKIILRSIFKNQRLTVEQYHAQSAQGSKWMKPTAKGVEIERVNINGLPAAWIRPVDAAKEKVILHLHGGGYVTGSIDSHLMMCIPMAKALQRTMLLPEYRLAPEHPFPAALDDALKAYRWLLSQGIEPKDIVISGDSAGGGLALATALSLRDTHEPLPAALICMSPWADLTNAGKSHTTRAKSEPVLRTDVLNVWARYYTAEANLTNPLVSPVHANLRGFPPLLIQVGSEEVLLDDSVTLAEKAKADGVDVTLKVWDGLWHVWPALGDLIPESRAAFNEMNEFLRRHQSSLKQ